jgi:hypothetical protein
MQTKPKHTVVVIPNNEKLEVSYFCSDDKLKPGEKKEFNQLIIQLQDCLCTYKVPKNICHNGSLENIVQKTVINTKGHLC